MWIEQERKNMTEVFGRELWPVAAGVILGNVFEGLDLSTKESFTQRGYRAVQSTYHAWRKGGSDLQYAITGIFSSAQVFRTPL